MNKVLQINSVCNIGSTGRIAEDLGNVAIETGWESCIAYGRKGKDSKSKTIKIGSALDVYIHYLYTRLSDRHGFASRRATKQFIKEIINFSPDIIHLHNIHGYYLNIEILFNFLKEYQKPIVWTLHDCWAYTGHCAYYDSVNCTKWETGCYNCPITLSYPKSYIDNSKFNFKKKKELFSSIRDLTIVTPSKWLAEESKKSFLSPNDIIVINNGIDLNSFNIVPTQYIYEKYKINKDKFTILGVANIWDKRKGLEDFVKLSSMVEDNIQIILLGLNNKQLKELPNNVLGFKRTANIEELAMFYSFADVFVNLTYEDNFPTTNLEALACGTPVITYNTGGSPEAVDTNTGIIVDKGDIQNIYNSISKLIDNTYSYESNMCRKRALKYYNKDDRFKEYINLYESLLKK